MVIRSICWVWSARFIAAAIALSLAPTGLVEAQSATTFEVASIRASRPDGNQFSDISFAGQTTFMARRVPLSQLIQLAYGLETYQLDGGVAKLESPTFDISAKTSNEKKLDIENLRPLLQNLLIARFHLAVHRESKNIKGYELKVERGGLKVPAAKGDSCGTYIAPNKLQACDRPMSTLATLLVHVVNRPVIDETSIKGNYNFTLDFAQEGDTNSSSPSIFTALKEQLGLRLERGQIPVEMLVIDHLDKTPTEN